MTRALSKKALAVVLSVAMLLPFAAFYASAGEPFPSAGITPYFNNTASASYGAVISSTGKLTVNYDYDGFKGVVSKVIVEMYVEKRVLGFFWQEVEGGTWFDVSYDYCGYGSHELQLTDQGTYRIRYVFTVYGSGGDPDIIKGTLERKY